VLLYASRPGFGEPHPFRPADLPPVLVEEIDFHFSGLTRGQEPLARCLWFDAVTRQCKHYEHRPQLCRDYELGGQACLLRRSEAVQNGEAVLSVSGPWPC
jgi:Fe-S-cluster containining protein